MSPTPAGHLDRAEASRRRNRERIVLFLDELIALRESVFPPDYDPRDDPAADRSEAAGALVHRLYERIAELTRLLEERS